jgi:capsular polysaccharide biosynthesis protein/MinD-like ATPase involved in chromosome partitioning or flagellar assembly
MSAASPPPRDSVVRDDTSSAIVPAQQLTIFARALRRHWWVVASFPILAGAAAFAVSTSTPKEYQATAKVLLDNSQPADAILQTRSNSSLDPERDVNTGVAIVKLAILGNRVRQSLHLPLTTIELLREITASTQGNSNVLEITARDRHPQTAIRIANAFADQYVRFRRSSARAAFDQAAQFARTELQSLPPSQQRGSEGRALNSRVEQLAIAATLQTGGVQLLDQATAPITPVSPRPKMTAVIAAFFGLIFGGAFAILQDLVDRRLRREEDVEQLLNLPVLARVPRAKRERGSVADGRMQQEAYATLAISLRSFALGADDRVVVIASTQMGEGKTSTIIGVGRALAAIGQRVIAIEGDLRRPRFAAYLGIGSSAGLTAVIEGQFSLEDALIEAPQLPGASRQGGRGSGSFRVLPAGRVSADPHRLLSSARMAEVVMETRDAADIVLIDTPALAHVSDAASLAAAADICVFVVRLSFSRSDEMRRAIGTLTNLNVDLAGMVLTGVKGPEHEYYGDPADTTESNGDTPAARIERIRSHLALGEDADA